MTSRNNQKLINNTIIVESKSLKTAVKQLLKYESIGNLSQELEYVLKYLENSERDACDVIKDLDDKFIASNYLKNILALFREIYYYISHAFEHYEKTTLIMNTNISFENINKYNIFAREFAKTFSDIKEEYMILLVSKACRCLSVFTPFRFNPKLNTYLIIQLPRHKPLDSRSTPIAVVHELAHYVENDTRYRLERKETVLKVITYRLFSYLGLNDINVMEYTYKTLQEFYDEFGTHDNYLHETLNTTKQSVEKLLLPSYNMDILIDMFLESKDSENFMERAYQDAYLASKLNHYEIFNKLDEDFDMLEHILHECYADIVTIYILNVSDAEFCKALCDNEMFLDENLYKNQLITKYGNEAYDIEDLRIGLTRELMFGIKYQLRYDNFDEIYTTIMDYLVKCKEALEKKINLEDYKEILKIIPH